MVLVVGQASVLQPQTAREVKVEKIGLQKQGNGPRKETFKYFRSLWRDFKTRRNLRQQERESDREDAKRVHQSWLREFRTRPSDAIAPVRPKVAEQRTPQLHELVADFAKCQLAENSDAPAEKQRIRVCEAKISFTVCFQFACFQGFENFKHTEGFCFHKTFNRPSTTWHRLLSTACIRLRNNSVEVSFDSHLNTCVS